MTNPFDRTFFRFLLGFCFMLSLSFAVFYFVGKYDTTRDIKSISDTKSPALNPLRAEPAKAPLKNFSK